MPPLRIGIDAREVLGDATGVGRYLAELLIRWTARPDRGRRRFVLYAPEPIRLPLPPDAVEARILEPSGPRALARGGRGTWWEQTALRRAVRHDPLDLFFAPAYTAPLGVRVPLAVTIHDVSFLAHPEWYRATEGLRRRWLTARAAAAASIVFTDSAFSRSEIERFLRVDPRRVRVVPPGVSPRHRGGSAPARREPLVLYAGSLFNRRRLPDLIRAFARATTAMAAAHLVIVGDDRTWPPQDLAAIAAAEGVASRVQLRSYVSDGKLAELYARASAFVFLSEYEGFGLTPLEALAAGVPVIVLDTAVAREVYGPAASYVAPGDLDGTAALIRTLLTRPDAGAPTLAHAPGVLARYSWERAADETLADLERLASASRA